MFFNNYNIHISLQKKKIIVFAMENYFTPYNTFLFPGATYLDYDEKEPSIYIDANAINLTVQ